VIASVIIVNYNGAHFLPACLDALAQQSLPRDEFEVIVSDNGSRDGSLELLRERYAWVRLLDNRRNLGFAEGNNVAIAVARGTYIVLLNNDTAPHVDWLREMIACAEAHPRVGLVTGHMQLFYDQVELHLSSATFAPVGDSRALGVMLRSVEVSDAPRGTVQYLSGWHGWERDPAGARFRWSKGAAILGVPVPLGDADMQVNLTLSAPRPEAAPVTLTVQLPDSAPQTFVLDANARAITLRLDCRSVRALAQPLVQNVGSLIFRDGSGRDRGTYVRDYEAFYETDHGQYATDDEVFAGCGGSLLIRREMLADLASSSPEPVEGKATSVAELVEATHGAFDKDLFMYYEDTDLAWRARWRGWQVWHAARAIVRHIHSGSSGEWSPFFVYHVDRNRLAVLFAHGSARQVARAWAAYGAMTVNNARRAVWELGRRITGKVADWRSPARAMQINFKVWLSLIEWLPALIGKRRGIERSATVSRAEMERWYAD
jgi:GT2 family glycosyltransferase